MILASLLSACNNDEASDRQKDSANTLNDTMPANGFNDSMKPDSHPPDATRVDSLLKVPK